LAAPISTTQVDVTLLSGATVPVARSRQAEVAAKFPKA
jgi:hypothetical protein